MYGHISSLYLLREMKPKCDLRISFTNYSIMTTS